jgi:hypothetical protein
MILVICSASTDMVFYLCFWERTPQQENREQNHKQNSNTQKLTNIEQ